jgi:hypothetical protein
VADLLALHQGRGRSIEGQERVEGGHDVVEARTLVIVRKVGHGAILTCDLAVESSPGHGWLAP